MASKYEIWLFKENGSGDFFFPVLPEEISIDYGSGVTTVNIDGLGEVPVKSDKRAARISFSSYFPVERVSGDVNHTVIPPRTKLVSLREWIMNATPLRLNIVGTEISMNCVIESFKVNERGGDVGTRHFSISFVSREVMKMEKVDVSTLGIADLGNGARGGSRDHGGTYTVKPGDWLMKIAREQLGDSGRYMEIFNLNRDILKNPNLIYPGQVLKLPS
ncbi:MAG: LysM peptidoglycan-binding domain-containing protein [Oscillospiraceae bacterium]|nr:LysM peptidoglycan-binding domain-containing protein [Oscillospiraceae bacterium]